MRRGSPDSKAFEAPVPFLGLTGLQLISIVCSGKSQSEFFGTAGWRAVSVFPKAPFLETDTEDLTLCFLTTLLGTGRSGAQEETPGGVAVPGGREGAGPIWSSALGFCKAVWNTQVGRTTAAGTAHHKEKPRAPADTWALTS